MGSATVRNTTNMADGKKKSIKCLLKNLFGTKKGKENDKTEKNEKNEVKQQKQEIKVEALLENFRKLEIEKKKELQKKEEADELNNFTVKTVVEDERDEFTYLVVEDVSSRTERTESHSSQDSGFSEKSVDEIKEEDDVIETEDKSHKTEVDEPEEKEVDDLSKKEEEVLDSLQKLKKADGKKKKSQVVTVARTPIRNKAADLSTTFHPYRVETQINHTINKHTFSGGQVIVANKTENIVDIQVPYLDSSADDLQIFSNDLIQRGVQLNGQPYDLEIVQEYLDENSDNTNDILQEFLNDPNYSEQIQTITNVVFKHIEEEEQNPIEQLENTNQLNFERIENLDSLLGLQDDGYAKMFPTSSPKVETAQTAHSPQNNDFYTNLLTPPDSVTMSSPRSDSIVYQPNSVGTLSPNSDCEHYQEIPHYEDHAVFPEEPPDNPEDSTDKKARERNTSTSSLTLKNYKDLQKELAATFSKRECCLMNRKTCKEVFQAHIKKLKAEDRRNMCVKVASMDLRTIYGVLHHILLGLCRADVDEDLHMSLFALLCDKVLGQEPRLFAQDYGLGLLKAAALRCPRRPILTRYLVDCIWIAYKQNPALSNGKEFLFKEMDDQGDTLVTACARGGDLYADVLAEIVRREHPQVALFNIDHGNTEGYSALHVACREHSAASPRLHTVHVLLEHGGADIWKGDVRGNDTCVHMAVNSVNCELNLVLVLFKHLDRKQWKDLAKVRNRSSISPLDLARCASRSTTRPNYPQEVVEFLQKCR